MKYDFTSIIDRKGKDAYAVDGVGAKFWGNEPELPKEGFDYIPMWVADMNFGTAPAVIDAIVARAKHPTFGYFSFRDEYFESIVNWRKSHDSETDIKAEYINYENGIHGFVTTSLKVLSKPGDKVLIHSPVYTGFYYDIESIGREAVHSPLKQDENGIWRMDYEDMDRKLKENDIHVSIFCTPHNPTGRVWERWELEKAMEVYEANDCYVISDEIWADIVFEGHKHIPTFMVNEWAREHTVTGYAPSKTFNLAGLVGSYHVIPNPDLRERILNEGYSTSYNNPHVLSMHSLIGAYSAEGKEWADELVQVLENNARYTCDFINKIDGLSVTMPESTYMIFVDCTEYCEKTGRTMDEIVKAGWDVGVGWQDGRAFGGPHHIRMNLASPLSRIQEACERIKKYVFV